MEASAPEGDRGISAGADLTPADWQRLADIAWATREHASILGKTKVGCAVLTADGRIFGGCNVEQQYRSGDVHAEVNAISSMISAGARDLRAVLVVARRDMFTPCGGCMDWIFQFGGGDCVVGFQPDPGVEIKSWTATELMPFYPR